MSGSIDALTGLTVGAEYGPSMDLLIAENIEFALIVLDIDNLEATNKNLGIQAGDAIFRLIGKHITEMFSEPCKAFRAGADNFSILMPKHTKEEAFLLAEDLRRRICEEKLTYEGLFQSVSIGVSAYPEDGSRSADVSRRAESAMVRAKKSGRNCVCLAREEKLIPKTSHYTQAQLETLSEISERINVGEAALLREALDDLLRKYDTN